MAAKKAATVSKAMNKSEIVAEIAENTGVTKKEVSAVFEQLGGIIERHVDKKAVGEFTMPGLFKIKIKKVPAQKAQKNVPHPFQAGVFYDKPAKPASRKVRILPLKKLKEMAA